MHRYEEETIINFMADEKTAKICTSDPVQIRKLDRLAEQYPDIYKYINSEYYKGEEVLKRYEVPKKYIGFKKPIIISDERREKLAKQLKKGRVNHA